MQPNRQVQCSAATLRAGRLNFNLAGRRALPAAGQAVGWHGPAEKVRGYCKGQAFRPWLCVGAAALRALLFTATPRQHYFVLAMALVAFKFLAHIWGNIFTMGLIL